MAYETAMTMTAAPARDAAVLPLPPVVDTPAVLLLGFLVGSGGPVVLDASEVREVEPAAVPLLETLLRVTAEQGMEIRVAGTSAALRRRLAGTPLLGWLREAASDDELLFACPDRDTLGFLPSYR